MEAGTRTSYNQGRPDIRSILKNVQADYSHLSEIHVIAAGVLSAATQGAYATAWCLVLPAQCLSKGQCMPERKTEDSEALICMGCCFAGPGSMVRDVKLNCADLSPVLNSAPQLVYEIDSFAL